MPPATPGSNLVALATSLTIVAVTVYFLVVGKDVFIPLVLGIFVAYLILALSHIIERVSVLGHHSPPWIALTASIILFLMALAGLVQLIAGNITAAVAAAPQYQVRLEEVLAEVNSVMASVFNRHEPLTLTSILDQIDLRAMAGKFATALQSLVGNTFEIFIYVVFVLLEQRSFDRKLDGMFPDPGRQRTVRETLSEIGRRTERYVLIKTLVSLIIAAITYTTLRTVGVDFAAFLALLAFLSNFIPYVGAAVGAGLPPIVALLQTGSFSLFAVVIGVLIATHTLIGNVLEPRLMGRSLNLSPLLMIVALAVWGSIWGIAGMLLSVPLMVMAMITFAQFPRTRPLAVLMSENGQVH